MREKSLEDCRMEFLWLTDMMDTRTTMGRKYGGVRSCPHCNNGREQGVEESPEHLMVCDAYKEIRKTAGDPEVIVSDRARYLRKVVGKRKELELKLCKNSQSGPSVAAASTS